MMLVAHRRYYAILCLELDDAPSLPTLQEASRIEAVTSQPVAAAKAVGQHIAPVAGATIRESMKTAARVLAPGGLNSQPTSSIHEAK